MSAQQKTLEQKRRVFRDWMRGADPELVPVPKPKLVPVPKNKKPGYREE